MRAIIATDFDGQLRKLIWLTEYDKGISAGIYDAKCDPHASYHVDGIFHFKFTGDDRVLKFAEEKKVPLEQIAVQEQLLGTQFVYSEDIMRRLPQFTADRRADSLLVLGQSAFRDVGYLAINIEIIHRTHEPEFLTQAYSSYEDKSYVLVTVNLFRLQLFIGHEIGVIIYKRRATK